MREPKLRVAVIYGGRSGEHDVSCLSAASVLAHLDRARYDVVPVWISPEGVWVIGRDEPSGDPRSLVTRTNDETGALVRRPTTWCGIFEAIDVLREVDVAFPALHGPYGEDGTVQSVLALAGIPYVGNGVLASAAGMDKEITKKLLAAEGLAVADAVVLRPDQAERTGADLLSAAEMASLGLPVFVKPARAGSSIGVTRVDSWDDLLAAVEAARAADAKVLVEAAVPGREVDLAVLEHPDGRVEAGPPLEIRIAGDRTFFDYAAKYGDAGTVFDIPARLDAATTAQLQEYAVRAFTALDCSGLLRVDFFLPPNGEPVVNEVNTFPGFTAMSQFPRIWRAAGLDYPDLIDILIQTALARSLETAGRRAMAS
ncbi:D-alanine--D-alanine ligase [Micromonospora sp. KC606]|uniref:D-alanine--D-alanine ligase family protein n=1 Tax=Micromonospora sp. KC606 TaxID=2530379 RepID=UPI00104FF28E|nr:D-alanine--D-alanine ligase family protein [Micromonospora sp. KC606]TDC82881.1 D-alanine--D-alanine ligase [Micromonospora sp. KC606]